MGYSIRQAMKMTGCKMWHATDMRKKYGKIEDEQIDELRNIVLSANQSKAEDLSSEERQKMLDLQKIEINKQEIRKRQLEIQEIEGRLIPVTDAVAISGGRFRALRDGCLAIPRRIVDASFEAAKKNDRTEFLRIMNEAITNVFTASKEERFVSSQYEEETGDDAD